MGSREYSFTSPRFPTQDSFFSCVDLSVGVGVRNNYISQLSQTVGDKQVERSVVYPSFNIAISI